MESLGIDTFQSQTISKTNEPLMKIRRQDSPLILCFFLLHEDVIRND
jgi:hypothetical protein